MYSQYICILKLLLLFIVKPRIDRTNLQNLIFKVGHTVLLDVNVIGEPPPTITWTFKDKVSLS